MTKEEFAAWKKVTEESKVHWTIDAVQWHNHRHFLAYKGGENGTYISVNGQTAAIGTYEMALPHIGDAMFQEIYTKTFDLPAEQVLPKVLEKLGTSWLIEAYGITF